jgi:hypothetical protein
VGSLAMVFYEALGQILGVVAFIGIYFSVEYIIENYKKRNNRENHGI